MLGFFLLLVIAAIAGSIGRSIAGYNKTGCFVSIAVGFIGAVIGKWLAREMELPFFFKLHVGGQEFPLVWAIIGAAIFSAVISLATKDAFDEEKKN